MSNNFEHKKFDETNKCLTLGRISTLTYELDLCPNYTINKVLALSKI